MKRSSFVAALSLSALLAPTATSLAQSPAAQPAKPPARQPKAEADPLAAVRRETAIGLITTLADEARSFRDETLRARVQARAADALWETDQEKARTLFRRAWDAAEAADREAQRRLEEERRRQREQGGPSVWMNPPNLRSEVLRLASRRERALGEEFLAKLEEARKQQLEDAALPKAGDPPPRADTPESEMMGDETTHSQRLQLARQLLESDDVERARQFAEPALRRVSRGAIRFLTDLRRKAPAEADKVYAALVAQAAADPVSDANTVSLLSSYLFSPQFIVAIDRGGSYSMESAGTQPLPADVPGDLRRAFFQMAASVLLRPLPPPDQDRTTAGRAGTYFVIGRLLPFFEQFMPERVAPLRAMMASLLPDVSQRQRTENEHLLTAGLERDDQPRRDEVQAALDRLSRATTPAERDRAYQDAAFAALARNDPRAREFAERVEDRDARAQLLSFIDYDAVNRALTEKKPEDAVKLARDGALTHLQRVWAYTEAAKLLAKDNRARALEVFDEAAEEARRIDAEDADRPRALLAVLTPLFDLDAGRVWSLMPDLVKAVNNAPEFTGEDGRLVMKFQTRERASIRSSTVDAFNLQPVFAQLARSDMNRAVEYARGFTGEGPRASATLAVATAVLKGPAKPEPARPRPTS